MNLINCELALKTLKSGLPIIFPTDTLPAIGCLPRFSEIIYEFKKRDRNKPLILMGSEQKQLIDYVHESAKEDYKNMASKYWPGALTMIIPSSEKQSGTLTSSDLSLGLRIPNSYIAQSLLKETGPLLTSSANISGFTGSITAEGIALDFPSVEILGPIPWEKSSGKASTIISWKKSGDWRLIRKGQVLVRELN
ncbi:MULTISPECIES: L-threonylcarbamoyladenylate synthase [Prochlorococcus]|uniref:L-threonylcarbamoyladenylate synthase n=1 Tax=Prochlorococcus marinus str. MIT 9116 TaxID=167544 RepID=A0A0A1ZRX9_PROMR|nr:L-threonylcarbamoyladenylate synthase [Prochlorococcus marinus]KGF90266.1 YrdC/Sua5 family protein [Prochlorococcus marinus str. MIT 9107]KGF91291.1 YrdC/Sua5 family protein [Prochlorococcus marinus str. MIT 9116]KGF94795.1 YrdC/Sua5 family protein [Prochlorococcus marinus str. MIT 9123]